MKDKASSSKVYVHAIVVWLVLLVTMFVHGALRSLILAPRIGELPARQISVVTGSMLIVVITFVCVKWIGARSTGELVGVGLLWLALTVLFEIGLGLATGHPWHEVLADFNVLRGGLFPIVLAVTALAPLLTAKLRAAL